MKRKVLILAGVFYLLVVLWVGRAQWFSEIERQAAVSQDVLISQPIDLSKPGISTWVVPRKSWSFKEGEARLSLLVPRSSGQWVDGRKQSLAPLSLKVEARGVLENGQKFDRLVKNWYFSTSEPLDPNAKIWISFNSSNAEYGLAGVNIYPFESTVISINVTTPSPVFSSCKPVLKLVGSYDYAVNEALSWVRLVKNTAFVVAVIILACFSVIAWRKAEPSSGNVR